jgi:hypothetical protein
MIELMPARSPTACACTEKKHSVAKANLSICNAWFGTTEGRGRLCRTYRWLRYARIREDRIVIQIKILATYSLDAVERN